MFKYEKGNPENPLGRAFLYAVNCDRGSCCLVSMTRNIGCFSALTDTELRKVFNSYPDMTDITKEIINEKARKLETDAAKHPDKRISCLTGPFFGNFDETETEKVDGDVIRLVDVYDHSVMMDLLLVGSSFYSRLAHQKRHQYSFPNMPAGMFKSEFMKLTGELMFAVETGGDHEETLIEMQRIAYGSEEMMSCIKAMNHVIVAEDSSTIQADLLRTLGEQVLYIADGNEEMATECSKEVDRKFGLDIDISD